MIELLILLTALLILWTALFSYRRTRDPLCPMVVLSPMLFYMYVYYPLNLHLSGALWELFPDPQRLELVHWLYFLSISAFCLGALTIRRSRLATGRVLDILRYTLTAPVRQRMLFLGLALGGISFLVFASMVVSSGGPFQAFSAKKPFLNSPIDSGYYRDMTLFTYPALLLIASAWQGQRLNAARLLVILVIASPQLTMATFGARRGILFLIAGTLVVCWYVIRRRSPDVRMLVAGIGVVGILMLLLATNRNHLLTPWRHEVDLTPLQNVASARAVGVGDEYVCSAAVILATHARRSYYWGTRYWMLFVVRPIPKQMWPTKYEDFGMQWMVDRPGTSGLSNAEWVASVGFVPAGGSATGFVADLFQEFAWGCVLGCFLIGRFFRFTWHRWTIQGGFWGILYFQMLILSVYLVSQNIEAFFYRLLYLGLPSYFGWRYLASRNSFRRRRSRLSESSRGMPVLPPRQP